jgi:MFS superfamily sulfate permease-like transporter
MPPALRSVAAEMALILAAAAVLLHQLYDRPLMFASRIWPTVILALVVAVAVGVLVRSLVQARRRSGPASPDAPSAAIPGFDLPLRRYGLMAGYVVYVLALPFLGFALATLVFLVGAALTLDGPLRPKPMAAVVAAAAATYWIFAVLFKVPLPKGLGAYLGL